MSDSDPPSVFGGTPEERVRQWVRLSRNEDVSSSDDWTTSLMRQIEVLSVTTSPSSPNDATASFSYTVQPNHCNRLNNLHGGAAATLFDYLTTLSLAAISRPGFWQYLGVSRNLNVTYFRPVPAGTEVVIHVETVQMGKNICALRGTMKRRSDGALMASCEHEKVNIDDRLSKL